MNVASSHEILIPLTDPVTNSSINVRLSAYLEFCADLAEDLDDMVAQVLWNHRQEKGEIMTPSHVENPASRRT